MVLQVRLGFVLSVATQGNDQESEKVDKVRSVLETLYKPDLHRDYVICHMLRLDWAYPPLTNGTKAVDLLADDGKPRCTGIMKLA